MQNKLLQCAAGLLLLPLLGMVNISVIPQFWANWLAFLAVIVIGLPLLGKQQWASVRLPQVAMLWCMLAGVVVLQWMLHMLHSSAAAITTLGYLVTAFLMTVAGSHYRQSYGWQPLATTFSRTALLAAVAISVMAVLAMPKFGVWFSFQPLLSRLQPYAALSVAWGAAAWLYLVTSHQLGRAWAIISAVMLLAGTSLLMGGMGWWVIGSIAVIAILQQMVAIKTQYGSREKRRWLHLALLSVPAYLVVRWIFPGSPPAVPALLDTLAVAVNMGTHYPWLGVGAGNVGWQSFLAIQQPATPGRVGVFYHAPNALVQLWLDFGIFAVLALLAALFAWLRAFNWHRLALEQVWLLTMLGITAGVSMFLAPFHHAFYLLPLAFLLGAGEEKLQAVKYPLAGAAATLLASVSLVAVLGTAAIANAKLIQAERGSLQHPDTVARLQWAHAYSLLRPEVEMLFAQKLDDAHEDVPFKLWLTGSAMQYKPAERLAYMHTLFLALANKQPEAVRYLEYTLNGYPVKLDQMVAYYSPVNIQVFLNILFEARPPQKPAQPPLPAQAL